MRSALRTSWEACSIDAKKRIGVDLRFFFGGTLKKRLSSWDDLLYEIKLDATHMNSPLHGELHWRAVAAAGIEIASSVSERSDIALAFGMIHDSQRERDDWDPDHGVRAANWLICSVTLASLIGTEERELLASACLYHDRGMTTQNPLIGTLWDADRINLWRVGLCPDESYFSVLSGDAFIDMRDRYHEAWRKPPMWGDLISMVGK